MVWGESGGEEGGSKLSLICKINEKNNVIQINKQVNKRHDQAEERRLKIKLNVNI